MTVVTGPNTYQEYEHFQFYDRLKVMRFELYHENMGIDIVVLCRKIICKSNQS